MRPLLNGQRNRLEIQKNDSSNYREQSEDFVDEFGISPGSFQNGQRCRPSRVVVTSQITINSSAES